MHRRYYLGLGTGGDDKAAPMQSGGSGEPATSGASNELRPAKPQLYAVNELD